LFPLLSGSSVLSHAPPRMNDFQVQTFGTSGPLVFFVHGWPDTGSLFASQVDAMSKDHRCVVVTNPFSGHTKQRVLGPTFLELYRGFEAIVDKHRRGDEKIQLVAHDWGTMIGLEYERKFGKQRVEKLVLLDVYPDARKNSRPSWLLLFVVLLYQSWLIMSWLVWRFVPVVGEKLGNAMTTVCAFVLGAPGVRSRQRTISAAQNFYYVNFWIGLLWTGGRSLFPSQTPYRMPEAPLLFIYGSKKPVNFHPDDLEAQIRQKKDDGSRFEVVPQGHWVMRHPATTKLIVDFLKPQ